uniref:Uncharacterized protein n=1 Tax=Acrobeloides nanus TaxID=290746 RepID=A0A914CTT3_9BILA
MSTELIHKGCSILVIALKLAAFVCMMISHILHDVNNEVDHKDGVFLPAFILMGLGTLLLIPSVLHQCITVKKKIMIASLLILVVLSVIFVLAIAEVLLLSMHIYNHPKGGDVCVRCSIDTSDVCIHDAHMVISFQKARSARLQRLGKAANWCTNREEDPSAINYQKLMTKSVSTSEESATLTEEPTTTESSRHSKYNEKLKSSSDGTSAASGGEYGRLPPPGFRKPSPPNSPPRG